MQNLEIIFGAIGFYTSDTFSNPFRYIVEKMATLDKKLRDGQDKISIINEEIF